MSESMIEREEATDAAFKEAYATYLQYVDYRDRLMPGDPERRYAEAVVEASGEMFFLLSKLLRPQAPPALLPHHEGEGT
jgi:hypothetical protein